MQKPKFISHLILEMKVTHYFASLWNCPKFHLLFLWMSNDILQINFIYDLVRQILWFKEFCSLTGLEVFQPKLKNQNFPGKWFLQKVRKPLVLSYRRKESTREWIRFSFKPKNFHFFRGTFGAFWIVLTWQNFLKYWLSYD